MQLPHYRPRRSLTVLAALLTTSIAVLCLTQTAPAQVKKTPKTPEVIDNKRPLTHKDYDIWNTIQTPLISPDGKFVAYTLASPEGDSELVVRNVESGKEFRHSRGRIGGKGGAGTENKVQFASDGARVVFTIFPPKADPAKKGDKDAPRPSLGVINVEDGKVKIIPNVRAFQLPESDPEGLLYHKLPPVMAAAEKGGGGDDVDDDDDPDFLQTKGKGQGKKGGDAKQPAAAPQATPSDLVIHNMKEGIEAIFADVSAFTMTRDGATLLCVMAGKDADSSGLFAFTPGPDGKPAKKHLVTGKAKFSRFTWDEKQQVLAFFVDHSTAPKEPGKLSIYLWGRPIVDKKGKITEDFGAIEILNSGNTTGLKEGCVLTERGGLSFSEDGTKLFVGVAPPATPGDMDPPAKGAAKDDKAVVELWHWKDDFIQPMQKARGNQDKMRTYTAVFTGKGNKLVQLADSKMPAVTVSRDGNFALGTDDTPYRQLVAYDATYADIYLVKTSDGSRKPLLKKHHWGISFSPSGKYGIFYDGKDWKTVSMPNGTITNITAKITTDPKNKEIKFYNEDHDSPSAAPAYGICGWSGDDRFVYIYDKYDIWEISPTGSSLHCLTSSVGRREKIQFRYAKLDPKEKGIDSKKLMLLRAESLITRESGFFALNPESTK
ncbi:MAG TPA: hypothetical protein VE988_28030, partial [Gemmataceae bacterium]|nr:hypothetical protein [Gemmataceae bacterium]